MFGHFSLYVLYEQIRIHLQGECLQDGLTSRVHLMDDSRCCSGGEQHARTATIAVFAFVQAIIFNAPLMRVKVEPLAAAPWPPPQPSRPLPAPPVRLERNLPKSHRR